MELLGGRDRGRREIMGGCSERGGIGGRQQGRCALDDPQCSAVWGQRLLTCLDPLLPVW